MLQEILKQGFLHLALRCLARYQFRFRFVGRIQQAERLAQCGDIHQSLAVRSGRQARRFHHYMRAADFYLRAAECVDTCDMNTGRVLNASSKKPSYALKQIAALCLAFAANQALPRSEFATLLPKIQVYRQEAERRRVREAVEKFDAIARAIAQLQQEVQASCNMWSATNRHLIRIAESEILVACGCTWEAEQHTACNEEGLIED